MWWSVTAILTLAGAGVAATITDGPLRACSIAGVAAAAYWLARLRSSIAPPHMAKALARMQAVVHGAAHPIFTFNRHGVVTFANPASEKVFGMPLTEFVGHPLDRVIESVGNVSFRDWLASTSPDSGAVRVSVEAHRPDGARLHLSFSVVELRESSGMLFTAFVRDLTVERAALDALAKAKQDAEEANRAKSAFLANMSHELRTPLNAIIGYSELLKEDSEDRGDESAVVDLERIRTAGRHLLALIDDLLDLSKVEAGRMLLSLEDVSLQELLDEVVATVTPLTARNDNRFQVEIETRLGRLRTDRLRLKQVLINLLGNAAKFTSQGTISLRAWRAMDEGRSALVVEVRDTGIGMSSTDLERLFQPFVQADPSVTRKYGGTGLGLTISIRLVELLGGRLAVSSSVGQGSTFRVTLPLGIGVDQSSAMNVSTAECPDATALEQPGDVVLVIDDDPTVQQMLTGLLRQNGLATRVASTAAEGIAMARQLGPVAITLDLLMPDLGGWTVLRALAADPQLAAIPVVVLSVIDQRGTCYTVGSTHWLAKPLELSDLSSTIARVVGSTSAGRALIVDDDESARTLLTKRMHALGWECAPAENGRTALERLDVFKPNLVLLDLMMPELDGFAFLDQLRRHAHWSSVPVIVITAKDLTPHDISRLRGDATALLSDRTQPKQVVLEQVGALVASRVGRLDRSA